jgi:NlpC/P60 family
LFEVTRRHKKAKAFLFWQTRLRRSMRHRILVQYFCVLIVLLGPLSAISRAQDDPAAPRLLNSDEGLILVNTASAHQEEADRKPDCSHLVHQIYEASGFPYPYASSNDLYDGVGNFRRVSTPHPGDLVVWRGHVGILIDPLEKTFYSSVSSGLRTEYYNGPYWRELGRPRFYRYILRVSPELRTTNIAAPGDNSLSQTKALNVPERKEIAEPSLLENNLPAKAEPGALAPNQTSPGKRGSELPSTIMVVAATNRPTEEEIDGAISELNGAAGKVLRDWPSAGSKRNVMVYDQLHVERVDLKRDRGWATAEVEGRFLIASKGFEGKRRTEKLRWELRRTHQGWQLQAPSNCIYVPRDAAIRVLAAQLASLTQAETPSGDSDRSMRQQKMIVHALSFLFDSN